jgi:hypothetical protein
MVPLFPGEIAGSLSGGPRPPPGCGRGGGVRARFETFVPSSPALLGAIVYDCHSLEARDREKGAHWGGHARSTKKPLHCCRSPRLSSAQTVEPISDWGVSFRGKWIVMGPAVSLRSPWGAVGVGGE